MRCFFSRCLGVLELKNHYLVTEEAGAPKQPSRRVQRAYTKSHHSPTNLAQLGGIFRTTVSDFARRVRSGFAKIWPRKGHQTSIRLTIEIGAESGTEVIGIETRQSPESEFQLPEHSALASVSGCLLRLK